MSKKFVFIFYFCCILNSWAFHTDTVNNSFEINFILQKSPLLVVGHLERGSSHLDKFLKRLEIVKNHYVKMFKQLSFNFDKQNS